MARKQKKSLHETMHRLNLVNGEKVLPQRDCAKLFVCMHAARLHPKRVAYASQAGERAKLVATLNKFRWLKRFSPNVPVLASSVVAWARDIFFMRDNGASDLIDRWVTQVATPIARTAKNRRAGRN